MKAILLILIFISCTTNSKKEESPTDKRAHIFYSQGTRNLIEKEYTKALKNLLQAHKLKSNDSKIHNNLGMAYFFKDRIDKALLFVKKAVVLDKKNTDAKINLGSIYMKLKDFSKAEATLKTVLKDLTYEGQYRTYFNLGLINLNQGKGQEALKQFKLALKENENYCAAHFQIGHLFFKSRSYKKALKSYKNASLGSCYENPEPQYHQALSLIKLNQIESARLVLTDIVERFTSSRFAEIAQDRLKTLNRR